MNVAAVARDVIPECSPPPKTPQNIGAALAARDFQRGLNAVWVPFTRVCDIVEGHLGGHPEVGEAELLAIAEGYMHNLSQLDIPHGDT